MFLLPRALLVTLALLLPGAAADGQGRLEIHPHPEWVLLREHWQRWRARGSDSYDVTFQQHCECLPEVTTPVRLRVRDGKIARWSYLDEELPWSSRQRAPRIESWALTVDGLFERIALGMRRADHLEVDYDEELGFPTRVFIDDSLETADEETAYTVTDLQLVGADGH